MNLVVTGHHLELTDSLKNYVSSKMSKLEKHFDNVTKTNVILSVEKLRQKAEATIRASTPSAPWWCPRPGPPNRRGCTRPRPGSCSR